MPRKPSASKQLAEFLGTGDKNAQLNIVTQLAKEVNRPTAVITVLFTKGEVRLSFTATHDLTIDVAKGILLQAVEKLTEMEVQSKMEKEFEDDLAELQPDDGGGEILDIP